MGAKKNNLTVETPDNCCFGLGVKVNIESGKYKATRWLDAMLCLPWNRKRNLGTN